VDDGDDGIAVVAFVALPVEHGLLLRLFRGDTTIVLGLMFTTGRWMMLSDMWCTQSRHSTSTEIEDEVAFCATGCVIEWMFIDGFCF
jgi:hypothetical protein